MPSEVIYLGPKVTYLSSEVTYLPSELSYLPPEVTYLRGEVTFLSSEVTFKSSESHFPIVRNHCGPVPRRRPDSGTPRGTWAGLSPERGTAFSGIPFVFSDLAPGHDLAL